MRLADKIVEQARTGAMPMRQDWQLWAGKLQQATCYTVDPTAGQLSFGTTEVSAMRAAARGRPNASLPAPITWFEWTGPSAAMGPRKDKAPRLGSAMPLRSGVLVEAKDGTGRYGVMSWMYELPGGSLEPTPLSVLFDWRDAPEEMPDLGRIMHQLTGNSWERTITARYDKIGRDGFSMDQVLSEERRWGAVPCPHLPTFWKQAAIAGLTEPDLARKVMENAFADLEGEPKFIMGLVICLCTDGLLDAAASDDMSRLNAARRKRGRTELLSFHRLSASGRNVIRLSDRGGALETMQGFHAA